MKKTSKEIYEIKELFHAVQTQAILEDGKTFVDCIPKHPLTIIETEYLASRNKEGFDLKSFVLENFSLPAEISSDYQSNSSLSVSENIRNLWAMLTRQPSSEQSSLINLPHQYIVPGGRFREIYYWDSYFTMLGLREHGRVDLIENMVSNFAFLIDTVGHIPNGNRQYYISRSQPPFFALMVQLLADIKKDDSIYLNYKGALEKEYQFWQEGSKEVSPGKAIKRVVRMPDGTVMNRYFDSKPLPREESYAEDLHISKSSKAAPDKVFTHLRAGAESGWDFSSRWFADDLDISTIQTTEIVPVDLNCLMYLLEIILAKTATIAGNANEASLYIEMAAKRKSAILQYCWNASLHFFCDYHVSNQETQNKITAAGLLPLFVRIANQHQANNVAAMVEQNLLKPGGLVTTTIHSGQQWDAPNGWAPLQWIAFDGLQKYGHHHLAKSIAERWIALNEKVFAATGKLMEKYNVEDLSKLAGGGEYAGQDGFGWTNGVYLALKKATNNASLVADK